MKYSISEIASLIGADVRPGSETPEIEHLLTDSRSLLHPSNTLFFALRTPSGDGHRYIDSLYRRGVRGFVVEQSEAPGLEALYPEAGFLAVPSVIDALQRLAGAHRAKFDIPVIALTGSRGKTTVKEWLHQLLRGSYVTARSPRSFNSQIGVPLSLWGIGPETEAAIIEAGISEKGEMERLERIIRPTIGIFNNLGVAHSDGFESADQKAAEKALLLKGCKTVIYNADNEIIARHIPECVPDKAGWSMSDPSARLYIKKVSENGTNTRIDYVWDGTEDTIEIPFASAHDAENAIGSLALMLVMGIDRRTIAERMKALTPVATRLDVTEGLNDCRIIRDNYAADVASMAQALDFAERRLTPGHTLTLILGDLTEEDRADMAETYRRAGDICRMRGITEVILCGQTALANKTAFGLKAEAYGSVEELLKTKTQDDFHDRLIVLKGAPSQPFNLIVEMLEARQHETVLEINLDAVVHNFNYFRSLIKPVTGMVCMIKASGYGAGAGELAKTLQSQGASYFAVAVHDEGIQLRREGITLPIIVLNPVVDNFKTLFDNRLEPEIYSIDFLKRLISEANRLGVKEYPVHIKIDSGMHRLGFLLETLPEVIELLKSQDAVVPRSIFSHLCAADDPMEDDYTRSQFEYFDRCCEMLREAFPGRRILRHILNSTGITRFPDHQLDMVRLGIGLYGVRTMHDGSQDALRPVSTLRTVVISLKEWPAGTTIGYNRRGVLARKSVIATVPIGYADGLDRHLGYGNASFLIGGHLCPTVGSICMDACMVDVTDVPGVKVGDSIEIFGENVSVDTLADALGTIPYEILTSVSDRVKRIYYRE